MSDLEVAVTSTPGDPFELTKPKLLIGEGHDEVVFFGALLKHLGIDDVQVTDYRGKQKLPAFLDALKKLPGFSQLESLGVTRDADLDAVGAFASVSNHLMNCGLPAPASSGNIEVGIPRVRIMILPDGKQPGMLEDLFLEALGDDSLTQCIGRYFECVGVAKGSAPRLLSKARVHAWLAAQDPPDMRLGIAAQKGLVEWNNPSFDQLRDFLTSL